MFRIRRMREGSAYLGREPVLLLRLKERRMCGNEDKYIGWEKLRD